jgi:hypothetical protein
MQSDLPRDVFHAARLQQHPKTGRWCAFCPIQITGKPGYYCPGFLGELHHRNEFRLGFHVYFGQIMGVEFHEWRFLHPNGYRGIPHGDDIWYYVLPDLETRTQKRSRYVSGTPGGGRRAIPEVGDAYGRDPVVRELITAFGPRPVIGHVPYPPCVIVCPRHGNLPFYVPEPDPDWAPLVDPTAPGA